MNIICFLTLRPNKLFYDFCKTLIRPDYEVYICIDDNSYDIPSYDNIIKIIKIDNQECIDAGFKSTVLYFQNQACSRDKALYYFSKNDIDYKYIWFIEEDVFLPTSDVINNLDDKYHDADLLCRSHKEIKLDLDKDYHIPIKKTILYGKLTKTHAILNNHPPFANLISKLNYSKYTVGMISAIRVSKKLMNIIKDFALEYKTLFIDEAFFSTISYKNNLLIITPIEFNTILFTKIWKKTDINLNNLYHPIKDIKKQYEYRNNNIIIETIIEQPTQNYKINKKVLLYKK